MVTTRTRTLVVLLLTAVVALRVSVSQPLTAAAARVAHDPGAALRHAVDGWTVAGTLGGASAQGVRDAPLAVFHLLGAKLGLSPEVLQTAWRVMVLVVGVLGAIGLARAVAPENDSIERPAVEPWTPWVAASLYGVGAVLVPTLVRSPLEGLAAAALPWSAALLLCNRALTWPRAAAAAAWLGLAGVGGMYWALAAVVASLIAVGLRARREPVPALRWLAFAVLSSAWWVATTAWELAYARDVSSLLDDVTLRGAIEDFFGGSPFPYFALLVAALGPFLVCLALVLARPAGAPVAYVGGLLGAAAAVAFAWLAGVWVPAVVAPVAQDPPASIVGPVFALLGVGAVVAWTPLVNEIGPRVQEAWAAGALPRGARDAVVLIGGVAAMVVALGGLAVAAVEPAPPADDVPTLDRRVAAWSEDAPSGRVLVVPAAEDAPAWSIGAALGERPWVARNNLPTSGAMATVALDDLLDRLGHGDGGPGTSSALQRLGIAYVLVQLGGPVAEDRANPTALVRAALVTAGASRTAVLTGTDATETGSLVDSGVRGTTRQVEVWSVPDAVGVQTYRGQPVVVAGDAGSVSDLAAAGLLGGRSVRLTGEEGDGPLVLSDSARRRDLDQRLAVNPYGPVLDEQAPRLVVPPSAAPVTTATRRVEGVDAVSASSSAADVDTDRRAGTDALAAVDGNPFTAWQSPSGTGVGEWWEIDFGREVDLSRATVQFVRNPFEGNAVTSVHISTDDGGRDHNVPDDGLLPIGESGRTETVRIAITGVNGDTGTGDSVGIAEVSVPGVEISAPTVVAGPAAEAWVLAARPWSHPQCVPAVSRGPTPDPGELSTVCRVGLSVLGPDSGTLERVVVSAEGATVSGQAWVRAARTAEAAAVADDLAQPSVVASSSSVAVQDLTARAQAAADDDESTAWRPAPDDRYPSLTLAWDRPAEVTGVQLTLPESGDASVPTKVRIAPQQATGRGGSSSWVSVEASVGEDGSVSFPPVRTKQLTITVLESFGLVTVDSFTGALAPVPVAVSEVRLEGGPAVRYESDRTRELGCGSGPDVTVGGEQVRTRISTSARAVVTGVPVLARLCASASIQSGETDVRVDSSFRWLPLGLALWRDGGAFDEPSEEAAAVSGVADPGQFRDLRPGSGSGRLTLDDSDVDRTVVLSVPEGTGWHARSAEGALSSVVVDGWAQGWVVPPGTTQVTIDYAPADVLGPSVAVGAVAWALLALAALVGAVLSVVRSAGRPR